MSQPLIWNFSVSNIFFLQLTGQIWTEPEQLIRLFQKNDKEITDSFRLLSKLMCRELVKPYSDRLVQKLKELRLYFIKENERYEVKFHILNKIVDYYFHLYVGRC